MTSRLDTTIHRACVFLIDCLLGALVALLVGVGIRNYVLGRNHRRASVEADVRMLRNAILAYEEIYGHVLPGISTNGTPKAVSAEMVLALWGRSDSAVTRAANPHGYVFIEGNDEKWVLWSNRFDRWGSPIMYVCYPAGEGELRSCSKKFRHKVVVWSMGRNRIGEQGHGDDIVAAARISSSPQLGTEGQEKINGDL